MSEDAAPKKVWPKSKGDPAFTKRLKIAFQQSPASPPEDHGARTWLQKELEKHSIHVTVQSVAKWFSGSARPRPDVMREIARVLRVDEAWLSLGTSAQSPAASKSAGMLFEEAALNLVGGLIQFAGGKIATSSAQNVERTADITAIIDGHHLEIEVKSVGKEVRSSRVRVSNDYERHAVLIVSSFGDDIHPRVLKLSHELIDRFGKKKGGFIEVPIDHNGQRIKIGNEELSPIRSLEDFGLPVNGGARTAALKALDLN